MIDEFEAGACFKLNGIWLRIRKKTARDLIVRPLSKVQSALMDEKIEKMKGEK